MSVGSVIFTIALCVAAAWVGLWLLLRKFYRKASREMAFVRTGFGGQKIVMNAGALVIPVLHEVIPVNMNTLRLEVVRANNQALITRDRMRVDVHAEFFVRVKPTLEAVGDAAQTLGRRTTDAKALQELIEGRFVDALRAVAAEMNMDELHEKRIEFVHRVQNALTEDLVKNGLELESVSLSAMDQTDQSFFNPQNAFDAQGLTMLTEVIQARMQRRNEIERDTEVAMRRKNLEAERHKLELSKEEEFARLEQQREIELRRADQKASVTSEQVEKERLAREAEIVAKERVDKAEIMAARSVEEERIAKERFVREKEIEREKALDLAMAEKEKVAREAQISTRLKVDEVQLAAERALEEERIAKNLQIREKEIEMEKALKKAEVHQQLEVSLAEQDRTIALADKSKEVTAIEAEANKVRLTAIKAEEQVTTARQIEVAERQMAVDLIDARKKAEREALALRILAEARKKAALEEAEGVRVVSQGEADKIRITAEADAEADKIRAEAAEKRYAVEAAGARARHEAENLLDPNVIAMRVKMAVLERLPEIIRESVKPMETIEGIKIVQVDGLRPAPAGTPGRGEAGAVAAGGNLAEEAVNAALRYRGQAPIVDAILKEIGIKGNDIRRFASGLETKEEQEPPE